jgi:hypothetical protein
VTCPPACDAALLEQRRQLGDVLAQTGDAWSILGAFDLQLALFFLLR